MNTLICDSDMLRLQADIMDLREVVSNIMNEDAINSGTAALDSIEKILELRE